MRLITDGSRRLDRRAELEQLINRAQISPFELVAPSDRQKLKRLLDLQHLEQEYMRYGLSRHD